MKKVLLVAILTAGALLLTLWLLLGAVFAPSLEPLAQADSPDGRWRAEAYLVNGGATTAYGVRVYARERTGLQRIRRIYWQYPETDVRLVWLNSGTIEVNGVTLDVRHDAYDYRDQAP